MPVSLDDQNRVAIPRSALEKIADLDRERAEFVRTQLLQITEAGYTPTKLVYKQYGDLEVFRCGGEMRIFGVVLEDLPTTRSVVGGRPRGRIVPLDGAEPVLHRLETSVGVVGDAPSSGDGLYTADHAGVARALDRTDVTGPLVAEHDVSPLAGPGVAIDRDGTRIRYRTNDGNLY